MMQFSIRLSLALSDSRQIITLSMSICRGGGGPASLTPRFRLSFPMKVNSGKRSRRVC